MVGVMSPIRALEMAREQNLDLVEISPGAVPPVCKLMDFGRFKYEQSKKENEVRKRQKITEIKEIRLHPHTDSHDVQVRVRKIIEFLGDGDKVKVSVQFRGREMFHPELGRQLMEEILNQVKNYAVLERSPMMEGRNMWMMLSKSPTWDPSKKAPEAAIADVLAAPTAVAEAFQRAAPPQPTPSAEDTSTVQEQESALEIEPAEPVSEIVKSTEPTSEIVKSIEPTSEIDERDQSAS